jgi:hypothetical protein
MVALADGSVRFLRGTIDAKAFQALTTAAAGEIDRTEVFDHRLTALRSSSFRHDRVNDSTLPE